MILVNQLNSLTLYLTEIFDEVAAGAVAENVGFQVFDVKDTERRRYDYQQVHGLDVIQQVAEGQDLPEASTADGDSVQWTQQRYGGLVPVTKDMRKFDLYEKIESVARSAAMDAFDKIDQSLADVLLFGTSTSYTNVFDGTETATGPDGLAFFSTAHTNNINATTFRNIIRYNSANNPVLSREAVVAARAEARRHQDPFAHTQPVRLDTLLVGPTNEDLAMRIVHSSGVQGTPDVDINPLKSMQVKVWDRLDLRTGGTDTSAYWFLYDSRRVKEALRALFAERPSLDAPEQVYRSKNWEYSIDFYYTIGRGYPAGVWGSTGVGS